MIDQERDALNLVLHSGARSPGRAALRRKWGPDVALLIIRSDVMRALSEL